MAAKVRALLADGTLAPLTEQTWQEWKSHEMGICSVDQRHIIKVDLKSLCANSKSWIG